LRTGEYVNRLLLVGIATLVGLVVGLTAFAWSIRPASGGFPDVSGDLQLYLNQPTVAQGFAPDYDLTLTHTSGGGATLSIVGPGYHHGEHWVLLVNNLGTGRLCTPSAFVLDEGAATSVPEPPQHVDPHPSFATDTPGTYHVVGVDGSDQFFVKLCWDSDAPVEVNGAYLRARFPPLFSFGTVQLAVGRGLNLGSGTTLDYAVQSLVQPTSVTPGGWQWSKTPAENDLAFAAVNTSDTQHDSYQAFLSGIVFGVAGGALVALVQELVAPFRSRKELRPPEPGG